MVAKIPATYMGNKVNEYPLKKFMAKTKGIDKSQNKRCLICKKLFYRTKGVGQLYWNKRTYCSYQCYWNFKNKKLQKLDRQKEKKDIDKLLDDMEFKRQGKEKYKEQFIPEYRASSIYDPEDDNIYNYLIN